MARQFDDTSTSKIDCGTSATLNPTSFVTLSAWVNIPSFTFHNGSGSYIAIAGRNTPLAGSQTNYIFYVKSTGAVGWYANAVHLDPGAATLSPNTWYHLLLAGPFAAVGTWTTYVNGSTDGTFGAGGGPGVAQAGNAFQIGADGQNPGTFNANCAIADVAVWSVALTAAEALAISKGARPINIRQGSLVGWWPLTGLQSPEPDLSGNKNNGTLTGTSPAFGPPLMQFTPRWPQWTEPPTAAPTVILPPHQVAAHFQRKVNMVGY